MDVRYSLTFTAFTGNLLERTIWRVKVISQFKYQSCRLFSTISKLLTFTVYDSCTNNATRHYYYKLLCCTEILAVFRMVLV